MNIMHRVMHMHKTIGNTRVTGIYENIYTFEILISFSIESVILLT